MKNRSIVLLAVILISTCISSAQTELGTLSGVVRDQAKTPLAGAVVTATKLDDSTTRTTISGLDGYYQITNVAPGMYSVMAEKEGLAQVVVSSLQVSAGKPAIADFVLVPASAGPVTNVAPGGFWKRFAQAYWDDWHDKGAGGPEPKYRGYPAPESNPPFPFTVWPYGGSPVIGQPNTQSAAADDGSLQRPQRRKMAGQQNPDLRMDRHGLQRQQFQQRAFRERAGRVRHRSQLDSAGSGGSLHRACTGYRADGSLRLGLPPDRHLRRGLPVHDFERRVQQSAAGEEPNRRVRSRDGICRSCISRRSPTG